VLSRNITIFTALVGCVLPIYVFAADMSPGKVFKDCEACPEMVVIPSGGFQMGDESKDNKKNTYRVGFDRNFAIGKYEITQAQWRAFAGQNPSKFSGDKNPVEQVSWNDVQAYIRKLNAKTGQTYRLLTQAEWEYVAQAGTTPNYLERDSSTVPVGSSQPNAFGVYDMHGNVWEWVDECYRDHHSDAAMNSSTKQKNYVCVRGKRVDSWSLPRVLHPANRDASNRKSFRDSRLGFRLARAL